MARAATETQRAGLSGLEFGLAIPGTIGGAVWANAGAHGADVAAVLESARDPGQRRDRVDRAGRRSRPRLSRQPVEAPASGRVPGTRPRGDLPAGAGRRRYHQGPASTTSDTGARPTSRSACHRPAAHSAIRPGIRPAASSSQAGLKGTRIGGATVSAKHANFLVNDGTGTAADVRRLADLVRATIAERDGIELAYEIEFVGDWTGWPWPAEDGMSDRRRVRPPTGRRAVRRPIAPNTTCRSCPAPRSSMPSPSSGSPSGPGTHRPRRRLVAIARRSSSRWAAGGRLRHPGTPWRAGSADAWRGAHRVVRRDRRRGPARRLHCAPRPVRGGRHDPGGARSRGTAVHGVRGPRERPRDGQGPLQADVPGTRVAPRGLARGPRGALGDRSGRGPCRARGLCPGHLETRGSWSSRPGWAAASG